MMNCNTTIKLEDFRAISKSNLRAIAPKPSVIAILNHTSVDHTSNSPQIQPMGKRKYVSSFSKMAANKNVGKIKWSFIQEKYLIEKVKERRPLWDVKSRFYRNRYYKRNCYQEIAEALAEKFPENADLFTDAEVMAKFGNLRTVFQRQKRIFTSQLSDTEGIGFVPKSKHFLALQFLGDAMEDRSSSSNLDIEDKERKNYENEDPKESNTPDDSFILDNENELTSSSSTSRKNTNDYEIVALDSASESLPRICSSESVRKKSKRQRNSSSERSTIQTLKDIQNPSDDEEDCYGRYIAKVLKSFDPMTRDLCKCEFQNIIFKLRHEPSFG